MSVRLHVFPPSPRAFKVLVVAHHLGLDYELALCDLTKAEQKSAAYTAINPNQRMPSLEDGGFDAAHIATALYWFHPLCWLAAARLRAESERACDDAALRLGLLPSRVAGRQSNLRRRRGRPITEASRRSLRTWWRDVLRRRVGHRRLVDRSIRGDFDSAGRPSERVNVVVVTRLVRSTLRPAL